MNTGKSNEIKRYVVTEKTDEIWITTTIESGYNSAGEEAWYLTGLYKAGEIPIGLTVRKH